MKPDAVQLRVLGALLEKQRTTPDVYPLTLNALRGACNQTTNRDPVVQYDDAQIRHALDELGRRRWTRSAGGTRAAKYRHLLNDTLGVTPPEQAVLAVLLLRGPQTPGELRTRTERMHRFADGAELEATIEGLVGRGLAARVERRPGQKEGRIVQLLGDAGPQETPLDGTGADASGASAGAPPVGPAAVPPAAPAPADAALVARVDALEAQVAALRDELAALRADLGA